MASRKRSCPLRRDEVVEARATKSRRSRCHSLALRERTALDTGQEPRVLGQSGIIWATRFGRALSRFRTTLGVGSACSRRAAVSLSSLPSLYLRTKLLYNDYCDYGRFSERNIRSTTEPERIAELTQSIETQPDLLLRDSTDGRLALLHLTKILLAPSVLDLLERLLVGEANPLEEEGGEEADDGDAGSRDGHDALRGSGRKVSKPVEAHRG